MWPPNCKEDDCGEFVLCQCSQVRTVFPRILFSLWSQVSMGCKKTLHEIWKADLDLYLLLGTGAACCIIPDLLGDLWDGSQCMSRASLRLDAVREN